MAPMEIDNDFNEPIAVQEEEAKVPDNSLGLQDPSYLAAHELEQAQLDDEDGFGHSLNASPDKKRKSKKDEPAEDDGF